MPSYFKNDLVEQGEQDEHGDELLPVDLRHPSNAQHGILEGFNNVREAGFRLSHYIATG